jgi:hypothetical protein
MPREGSLITATEMLGFSAEWMFYTVVFWSAIIAFKSLLGLFR